MTEDFQDEYSGSIDERLFPYYNHLETAVELFIGASERYKHLYIGKVEKAFTALLAVKLFINNSREKKGI